MKVHYAYSVCLFVCLFLLGCFVGNFVVDRKWKVILDFGIDKLSKFGNFRAIWWIFRVIKVIF